MNKKQIIVPALAGVLVVAWIFLVFMPASEEMKQLEARMQELHEKQNNAVSVLDVSLLRTRVDSLIASVDRRMATFYPKENLLDLGRTMERIGNQYNLELISISPDHESLALFQSNQAISELPVNLEYSGRFFDFAKFLDDMPEFPVSFKMKRMEVTKDEKEKTQLVFNLQGVIIINNSSGTEPDLEATQS